MVKIVVFVPLTHAGIVRKTMGDAGAGHMGNYSHCSFSAIGTGRFLPQEGAKPNIGAVGESEEVQEERIETICLRKKAKAIIVAIKKVHPYEEVALDVYSLINQEEL